MSCYRLWCQAPYFLTEEWLSRVVKVSAFVYVVFFIFYIGVMVPMSVHE